jgi:hypothetical protein
MVILPHSRIIALILSHLILTIKKMKNITNFMHHNLTIIIIQNLLISSYGININVIHLFVLLNIDVVCNV